jgi:transcriptional regulator with GAF, ATPase, and Fis domain
MATGDGQPAVPPFVTARQLVESAAADDGLTEQVARLQRVCRAAAAALSMRGCVALLVSASGSHHVATGSDGGATRVADIEFTTGEGPAREAFARRRPILVNDLSHGPTRWPGFTQSALESGIHAVFSFPLQIGAATLGVLQLHADRPQSLGSSEVSLAVAFSQLAAQTLLVGEGAQREGTQWMWEPVQDHRAEIHQAQGMVMVDLEIDLSEALIRMRAYAFSEGLPLIEVAHAVIQGLVLPAAAAGEPT